MMSKGMRWMGLMIFWLGLCAPQVQGRDTEVLVVVGAEGTADYGKLFSTQVATWKEACAKAEVKCSVIGQEGDRQDLALLETALKKAAEDKDEAGQFWLVLIGHGTYDGREAKFNLRGPDLAARQLGDWLKPLKRELVFIHTASASAGFITAVNGPRRVIVSATKGPDEYFYSRFGEHFAPAIAGLPEADLDQDRQVSVLEAFLYASRMTAEFYQKEERLASEHALIEDNNDGAGSRFEMYEGVKSKDAKADGARAGQIALVLSEEERRLTDTQRQRRDALERDLEVLKSRRETLKEDRYYAELEKLLRQLGEVYDDT